MYKIGIIGLGFMGGCIAKTLKQSKKVEKIIAYDINRKFLDMAKNDGNINLVASDLNDFSECDIIFLCVPVGFIPEYAEKLSKIVKRTCVITDIGSTKKGIVEALKNLDINFVGAHPMVGSERSGYNTSHDLLFENTYYILTENDNIASVKVVEDVVCELKAIPVIIDYKKHDYIVAAISHVPHIIAAGLVNMVKQLDDSEEHMKLLAAGGFKDITRIASSDPTMWEHICKENKEEIIPVLEKYISDLQSFKNNIDDSEKNYNFFESSKKYRDSFVNKKINGVVSPMLNVIIKDEKGSLAKVIALLSDNDVNIKNIGIIHNRESADGALDLEFYSIKDQDNGFDVLTKNGYKVSKIK